MLTSQTTQEYFPRLPKASPSYRYNITFKKRDDSYPSIIHRKKSKGKTYAFEKDSWTLPGQDREAAFIYALRTLYRTIDFPEVETLKVQGEATLKQLAGLPDFGIRTYGYNGKVFDFITRWNGRREKRLNAKQVMYNRVGGLYDATGPRHLCEVLRDAILGLLNAYRMGYVHRDISPDTIAFNLESSYGYILAKDGKSVEGKPRLFKGFIHDFSICKNMHEGSDQFTEDSSWVDLTVSTATPVLGFEKRSDYVHSPTFDLKSFLWLLLSTASEIICDYASGQKKVRLDDPEYLAAKAKGMNESGSETCSCDDCGVEMTEPQQVSQEQTAESTDDCGPSAEVQSQAMISAVATMDLDYDDPKNATGEQNELGDHDDDVSGINVQLDPDKDEDKKRKRNDDSDSRKDEVNQEQAPDTDEEDGATSDFDSDEDGTWMSDPDHWYFKALSPYIIISIFRPVEWEPPEKFEPPNRRPEYVAFQEDRMAYVLHVLLEPRRSDADSYTARPYRYHLIQKFEHFLFGSPGLKPFYPLAMELYRLNLSLFVSREEVIRGKEYTRDEIEEFFESYLEAFETYMPKEENWYYLDEYEGSDVQYKFHCDRFLGAFASPTHYRPS